MTHDHFKNQCFNIKDCLNLLFHSVFKDLITSEIENKSKVGIIATSRSCDCLHGDVQSGRGVHIFQCCVELGPLNQSQRCDVLSKLIVKKHSAINCDELEAIVK